MTSYTFVRRGPQRNGSHSAQKRRAAILAWQQQHPSATAAEAASHHGLSLSGYRNLMRGGTR